MRQGTGVTKNNGFLSRLDDMVSSKPRLKHWWLFNEWGKVSFPSTHLPYEGCICKWRSDICVFIKFVVWGDLYKNKRRGVNAASKPGLEHWCFLFSPGTGEVRPWESPWRVKAQSMTVELNSMKKAISEGKCQCIVPLLFACITGHFPSSQVLWKAAGLRMFLCGLYPPAP